MPSRAFTSAGSSLAKRGALNGSAKAARPNGGPTPRQSSIKILPQSAQAGPNSRCLEGPAPECHFGRNQPEIAIGGLPLTLHHGGGGGGRHRAVDLDHHRALDRKSVV